MVLLLLLSIYWKVEMKEIKHLKPDLPEYKDLVFGYLKLGHKSGHALESCCHVAVLLMPSAHFSPLFRTKLQIDTLEVVCNVCRTGEKEDAHSLRYVQRKRAQRGRYGMAVHLGMFASFLSLAGGLSMNNHHTPRAD